MLGVVVQVLVAWVLKVALWCGALPPFEVKTIDSEGKVINFPANPSALTLGPSEAWSTDDWHWKDFPQSRQPVQPPQMISHSRGTGFRLRTLHGTDAQKSGDLIALTIFAASTSSTGLPFLSLADTEFRVVEWRGTSVQIAYRGGLDTGFKRRIPVGTDTKLTLPLNPVWLGFTANSAIYATILLVLLTIPRALRRSHRRRRNRCINCGYDLGGATPPATCPECGTASAPRASAAATT